MTALSEEMSAMQNLPPQRKSALVGLLVFLFIVGVIGGVIVVRQLTPTPGAPRQAPPPQQATESAQAKARLSLKPATKTIAVGETLPISVELTGAGVQAVDIVLRFDPTVFAVGEITPGTILPQVLQQESGAGRIAVSSSVRPESPGPSETGTIFTVDLTALQSSKAATVDFDPTETIAAKAGENILGSTAGGKYTVE